MRLSDIALNNLRRRRAKSLFVLLGMIFGMGTIVTLFSITTAMEREMGARLQATGLRVMVAPRSESLSLSFGGIPVVSGLSFKAVELEEKILNQIRALPEAQALKIIAPKVMGLVQMNSRQLLLVGVDFPAETQLKSSWWKVVGNIPQDRGEVLLGNEVSMKLGTGPGQVVTLNGQRVKVAGILEPTGREEDGLVFTDWRNAQEILNKLGLVTFIELTAPRDTPEQQLLTGLSQGLPGTEVSVVKTAVEARQELIDRYKRFSLAIAVVLLVVGSLIVLSTMMSSVHERTREIGIFRAIGFRQSHIMKIILLEAGVLSLAGGLLGNLIGYGAAVLIGPQVAQLREPIGYNLLLGLLVMLISLAVGLGASFYPARQSAKLDPAEALRFI